MSVEKLTDQERGSMKEFEGTKGEWKADGAFGSYSVASNKSENGDICLINKYNTFDTFEAMSNAQLIASAPETLFKLQKTNESLKALIGNNLIKGVGVIQSVKETIRANEDQINKALGE